MGPQFQENMSRTSLDQSPRREPLLTGEKAHKQGLCLMSRGRGRSQIFVIFIYNLFLCPHICIAQRFSTLLMLWPFNTVLMLWWPPTTKLLLLLLHKCNFATHMDHNINNLICRWPQATPVKGSFYLQRGCEPWVENCWYKDSSCPLFTFFVSCLWFKMWAPSLLLHLPCLSLAITNPWNRKAR